MRRQFLKMKIMNNLEDQSAVPERRKGCAEAASFVINEPDFLRHDKKYREGKNKWTQKYYLWLSEVKLESRVEQIVFEEYVDAVKQAELRVASLEEEMRNALTSWSLSPVVESLMSLRGVNLLTAMSVMAELGDISRFDSPRELMSFVGLILGRMCYCAKRWSVSR